MSHSLLSHPGQHRALHRDIQRAGGGDTLACVKDVVEQLALRDRSGEVITAVHHIPARAAQWEPMPDWVRPELAAAYRDKGVTQLYSHQARAVAAVHEGRNAVVVTPTASGKTLCYNLPVLNRDTRQSRCPRAVSVPHQGAGAGPTDRTARPGRAAGRPLRRLHLRRRHAGGRAHGHTRPRAHRAHESRHAARGHSSAPYALDAPVREFAVHRPRRTTHLPRRLRQPSRECAAQAATRSAILWL